MGDTAESTPAGGRRMRFGDYLVQLPPGEQLILVNRLTLGCGYLTLAARLHGADALSVAVLGVLAAAHGAFREALDTLAPSGSQVQGDYRPALDEAIPRRWRDLVEAADPATVQAWLLLAVEMARDAALAATGDADVADVRDRLTDTLDALITLRDTAVYAAG